MKKIIILLCVFLLTGCYDNVEVENINVVEGIGIDYIDNSYVVTLEILNAESGEEESLSSFTISGTSNTISEAFTNVSLKSEKTLNYSHLDVVLISKDVAEMKLESIIDYLFRNNDIRDEFLLVVSLNSPEDTLKSASEVMPIVSKYIKNLIINESFNNSMGITDTFQTIMAKLTSKKQDIILNSISIDDDVITLNEAYIFHEYKSLSSVPIDNITLYNMLTSNIINGLFNKVYDDAYFGINITNSNSVIDVSTNTISIDVELKAEIIQNSPNFDLLDTDTYDMLNNDFSALIRNKIKDLVIILQEYNSDILGIQNIYYKKNNAYLNELWRVCDIDVSVDLEISTKGYIFEVEDEQ